MHYDDSPIFALSTPQGVGALAVIRISGSNCWQRLAPYLSQPLTTPRQMIYTRFIEPTTHKTIDDLMACGFSKGASFTGEESIELFPHGGAFIIKSILQQLYHAGFRPAEPGEFSRRAYLNGKIDLSAAEGIKALTEAQTESQWLAGRQLAEGRLARLINGLRQQVIQAMAYLEAQIDFPEEEEVKAIHHGMVKQHVDQVNQQVKRLAASYNSGKIAAQGFCIVLVGEPNAGKSTLMNALLGEQRAIVTDIAGTTRDYIESQLILEGRLIRLIDTAGLRESSDPVEQLGIERTRNISREADLALVMVPYAQRAGKQELIKKMALEQGVECLYVLSQADEERKDQEEDWLEISALTGRGMDQLQRFLIEKVDTALYAVKKESGFLTTGRQQAAMELASKALERFYQGLAEEAFDEMLAFELQEVGRHLQAVIGEIDHEQVLDQVFGEFCIGK